jgi:hypothetical protein
MDMAEGPLGTDPTTTFSHSPNSIPRADQYASYLKRNQRRSSGRVDPPKIEVTSQFDVDANKRGIAMREIIIKLWRNEERHDWSMEINGRFHEHISNEGLTDLVEGALIIAAKSLVQSSVNGGALRSP